MSCGIRGGKEGSRSAEELQRSRMRFVVRQCSVGRFGRVFLGCPALLTTAQVQKQATSLVKESGGRLNLKKTSRSSAPPPDQLFHVPVRSNWLRVAKLSLSDGALGVGQSNQQRVMWPASAAVGCYGGTLG